MRQVQRKRASSLARDHVIPLGQANGGRRIMRLLFERAAHLPMTISLRASWKPC